MPDPVNPYMPTGLDRLSTMLMALGSGMSSASMSGRSGWDGLPAAAQMYGGAMATAQHNAAQYDQFQQQFQQQEAYRKAQERELQLRAQQMELDQDAYKTAAKALPGLMAPQGSAPTPGMTAPQPGPTMGPGYFGPVGQAESGGKYGAVNGKGSGAYGKYQFMPETWASVAQANPQLGLPFNMKQATPEQQEAAMRALTAGNGQSLAGAGVQPTPESLYLAHRFGPNGAQTVMRADPNAPIAALFPPQWAAQNPDMQGVTVGQFRQGVQQRFAPQMPGPPPDPARYAPLTMSPRLAPIAALLQGRDKAQQEYGWKAYDESYKRQGETREQGNKDRDYQFQREKYAGEGDWVRGADGIEKWVPKSALNGAQRHDKAPNPGTEAGDVEVLAKAAPDSREYMAAYNRVKSRLIDGPNGLKYSPNMEAYDAPTFRSAAAAPAASGAGPDGLTPIGERNFTETQNKDHTYASRLANAIPQLEALVKSEDGKKYSTDRLPGAYDRAKAESSYVPDGMVSNDAKQFRQIVKDILTATLRRESGASIAPSEFVSENAKFIPQSGDDDKTIRQKLSALKIAARTIGEATGRPLSTYGKAFDTEAAPAAAPIRINLDGRR